MTFYCRVWFMRHSPSPCSPITPPQIPPNITPPPPLARGNPARPPKENSENSEEKKKSPPTFWPTNIYEVTRQNYFDAP